MSGVRVEAPARLHLGMLGVGGGGGRRFGGLGVAVTRPAVVLEADGADELSAEGPDADRALAFARCCQEALGLPGGARLRVAEAIPPHAGLGSGTKLALCVASAMTALHGRTLEPVELARVAGRGARSAVGLWTFALGGLVVEGGVRPGSERAAPLLVRHPVPEAWRCVLVIPTGEPGLSGPAEEDAFRRLAPTADQAPLIGQLVLTSLLPALVEGDVGEFGAAVTRLQQLVGESFESVQGGRFSPLATDLVEALLRHGAAGAGQSSWGPTVYGIVGSEAEGRELASRMEGELTGGSRVELVAFEDRGARVERR
jgi:beta-ribofuranosylaminobenzene 5'-phosphate synthase